MKKISLAILLLLMSFGGLIAQDLKKTKTAVTLASLPGAGTDKIVAAQAEVDKLMADAKSQNNAEAWLMKSQVYGLIAGNETLKSTHPNAATEAFTALNKYLELEPEAKKIAEQGFVGINDIYRSFFDQGVKAYNDKNWEQAYNQFSQLVSISDMLIEKKWTTATFDTTAYLFAGVTAQNSNKEEEATKYYKELADRKITGDDFAHIYVFLPNHFTTTKNEAEFKKYIAIAKEAYPDREKYWSDLEFDFNTGSESVEDVARQYREGDSAKQLTATQYFDYGNYFVADKKVRELDEAAKAKYLELSADAFAKSVALDSSNALAVYNAGVTHFSLWENVYDKARSIRGTTADIKTRRAQADKQADAAADKGIEWLEKAYRVLDALPEKDKVEENSLKTSARFLASLYEYKRERSKGNDAAYDRFDKKFKFYDTKY